MSKVFLDNFAKTHPQIAPSNREFWVDQIAEYGVDLCEKMIANSKSFVNQESPYNDDTKSFVQESLLMQKAFLTRRQNI